MVVSYVLLVDWLILLVLLLVFCFYFGLVVLVT